MDAAEKRRLKKLGKRRVEQQSQELQEHLGQSNPAAVGSKEWVANYRNEVERDRWLRAAPPDRMSETEAAAEFILFSVDPGDRLVGVPTYYMQCPRCHELLHSVQRMPVACACGALQLTTLEDPTALQATVTNGAQPRIVRLMGRGTVSPSATVRRPWWRFW